MFSTAEFQSWGKQNAILFASVMTKIEGRQDDGLLSTYGFRGFPSLALLDAEGEAMTKSVGRSLFDMQSAVSYVPTYLKLKAAKEAGKDVDEAALLVAGLGSGNIKADEAKEKIASVKLTDEQRKTVDSLLFGSEIMALARKAGRSGPDDKAAEAVYAAFKAGKHLPAGHSAEGFFDQALVKAAKKNDDVKALLFSFDRVMKGHSDTIKMIEERIAGLPKAREQFANNEEMLGRINKAEEQMKNAMVSVKKQIVDLTELSKKLQQAEGK